MCAGMVLPELQRMLQLLETNGGSNSTATVLHSTDGNRWQPNVRPGTPVGIICACTSRPVPIAAVHGPCSEPLIMTQGLIAPRPLLIISSAHDARLFLPVIQLATCNIWDAVMHMNDGEVT